MPIQYYNKVFAKDNNYANKPHLAVGIIGIPGRSQALLSAEVPHDESQVPPDNLLNIGANSRSCVNCFTK